MSELPPFRFAVIIPFFQREPGILRKCLQSILQQTSLDAIEEIIIVDDGSPVPAEAELSHLGTIFPSTVHLRVIRQVNAGVSAARNKALDSVSPQTTHIAYLDSDDAWLPEHLECAINAIAKGARFFFSNHLQLNSTVPAFAKASKFVVTDHDCISAELYRYSGCFVNQVIRSNPVGTSTVVHEVLRNAEIRFDRKYKYAGEDYMMWVSLARQLGEIYFCSKTTVVYGSGVNIFSGAVWGSKHLSLRIIDELQYRTDCLKLPELSFDNCREINVKIQELRARLRSNALAQLKRLDLSGLWLWLKHR